MRWSPGSYRISMRDRDPASLQGGHQSHGRHGLSHQRNRNESREQGQRMWMHMRCPKTMMLETIRAAQASTCEFFYYADEHMNRNIVRADESAVIRINLCREPAWDRPGVD